jgi:SAM-dependent methyltransferase
MEETIKKCLICGMSKCSRKYVIREHTYYSCSSCGILFLDDDSRDTEWVNKKYDEDYFHGNLKENMSGYMDYAKQSLPLRRYSRILLSLIMRHVTSDMPQSLLDVGCAYGFFLDEARKLGMTVHGLDLSEAAIQWMKDNLNIKGTVGSSSNAPEGPYDIITSTEVIEHVSDPRSFLDDLHKRLCDNGILAVHTGAIDTPIARMFGKWWWYLNPPDHRIIFSRPALRSLIADSGFQILEHRLIPYYWVGLNNMVLKLARIVESMFLGWIASKLPAFPLPVFEYCAQFLIAKKR